MPEQLHRAGGIPARTRIVPPCHCEQCPEGLAPFRVHRVPQAGGSARYSAERFDTMRAAMPLPKSVLCRACSHTYPEGWIRCPYCGHDAIRLKREADASRRLQDKLRGRHPEKGERPGRSKGKRPRPESRPTASPRPQEGRPSQRPQSQRQGPVPAQPVGERAPQEGGGGGRNRRRRRRGRGRGEGQPAQGPAQQAASSARAQNPLPPRGAPSTPRPSESQPSGGPGEGTPRRKRSRRRRRRGGGRGPDGGSPPQGGGE